MAYQKARRLKAGQVREPGERRTPNAREHQKRAAERPCPVAQRIGRLLLEHRGTIVLDPWTTCRLGEITETIDDRDDPGARAVGRRTSVDPGP
ncbi:hypothetical protein AB0958_20165 [Streptomyces sp. NPDC006655]|uniref:hypothetical protein n=1 Tax=Streptomyces sp. NPDC006655 TaxID=3156898 RepID=UPI00345198B2